MMRLELKAVAEYVRKATTEELLDRVTVYRAGMEPVALDLMEGELDRRGVTREDIAEYDTARRRGVLLRADGTVVRCNFCDRPAVVRGWGWHWVNLRLPLFLFAPRPESVRTGISFPVFPRVFARCEVHGAPKPAPASPPPPAD
ncbi:MAG TPA: hypothetical protein VM529_20465 [Gemmata sp.]|nr:hypothetical protein [Gemmata sp.]